MASLTITPNPTQFINADDGKLLAGYIFDTYEVNNIPTVNTIINYNSTVQGLAGATHLGGVTGGQFSNAPLQGTYKVLGVSNNGNGYYGLELGLLNSSGDVTAVGIVSRQFRASTAVDDPAGFAQDAYDLNALSSGYNVIAINDANDLATSAVNYARNNGNLPIIPIGQSLGGAFSQEITAYIQQTKQYQNVSFETFLSADATGAIDLLGTNPQTINGINYAHNNDPLTGPNGLMPNTAGTQIYLDDDNLVASPTQSTFIGSLLDFNPDEHFLTYLNGSSLQAQTDALLGIEPGAPGSADMGASEILAIEKQALPLISGLSSGANTQQQQIWNQVQAALQDTTGGYYVVNSGDTWSSLASTYGVDASTLQAINANNDPSGALVTNAVIRTPISVTNGTPTSPNINGSINQTGFYDIQTSKWITTLTVSDTSNAGQIQVISGSGQDLSIISASDVSGTSLSGGVWSAKLTDGGTVSVNSSGGTSYADNGTTYYNGTAPLDVTGNTLVELPTTTADGGLGTAYTLQSNGTPFDPVSEYVPNTTASPLTYSQDVSAEQSLATEVPTYCTISNPTGTVTNNQLTTINVAPLGAAVDGNANGDATDAGGVYGGDLIVGAGVLVATSDANTGGVFNNSLNDVVTDDWQPGDADVMSDTQNATDQVEGDLDFYQQAQAQAAALQGYYDYLADIADQAYTFTDTDPLLIDLTGNGISLTNWIDNGTYFDTNLNAGGNGADGMLHHTSWVNSGTGILALDLNGDGKINNITETLSEFFAGGSNPYHYADGLAALASLSTSSTVFSASTSRTDSATGKLYWNEIVIAQGLPDATGALEASQLETLAAAGISSISLVGSGNQGESLAGSAVTNRTTATTSSGGTDQVAAVSFQTDTTGDVTYSQNGGVVINSTPEGGATANTSYIDENASAQSLALSSGTLTDNGTVVAQHNGEAYNAVFAQGTDTVTVASGDTSSYWLSGGTGTTLNASGAKGNIYFLVTSGTTSYTGGSGFNIAQVTDSAPVSIDVGQHNLDEVIGITSLRVIKLTQPDLPH